MGVFPNLSLIFNNPPEFAKINRIIESTLFLIAKWTEVCLYNEDCKLGLNFNKHLIINKFCFDTAKCKGDKPSI